MSKTIDLMEYSTPELAQAAYVTDGLYGADVLTGGTASASGVGGGAAANGSDDDVGTAWADTDGSPWWWKYDLGVGVTKTVRKLRFYRIDSSWSPKDYTLHGSNNDSDWTEIVTEDGVAQAEGWYEKTFSNSTAYRYYRFTIDTNCGAATEGRVHEFEMLELTTDLQSYSEATIKTQGTYSLKGVATTDALNKTLTRTIT